MPGCLCEKDGTAPAGGSDRGDATASEPAGGPEPSGRKAACCGAVPDQQVAESGRSDSCGGASPDPWVEAPECPGYRLCSYVEGFVETPPGPVPRVRTRLNGSDLLGGIGSRLGGYRDHYRVAPGLYAVGRPTPDSEVLVTANYKLSFDALRRELNGLDAWVLVLDTRGINVWCAAGKKTFGTDEVILRVQLAGLERIVRHRRLVLPQLSAAGVSAVGVRKGCGFRVVWGPVKASDLREFLRSDMRAPARMRRVTFTTWERAVLVPVEISLLLKPALLVLLGLFLLSGLGPGIFSFGSAWSRGLMAASAVATGILTGAVVTPVLLPWLPGTAFSVKGALTGFVGGLGVVLAFWGRVGGLTGPALMLLTMSLSSYLAMNFTGSTPFTSPSGVEKEMRRAIPFQAGALLLAMASWLGSPFVV